MGKIRLTGRLVRRDLRRHPGPAVLLVLAITAATATLSLGLVLHGVAVQPYRQTRAATNGPDAVAQVRGFTLGAPGSAGGPPQLGAVSTARIAAEVATLTHAPGVTGSSGPYPVASAVVRYGAITAPLEAEGRVQAAAPLDHPELTAGTWVRPGGIVLERTFAAALGAGIGARLTLDGRPYQVTGIAVTAAGLPYPNLCYSPGGDCVFDLRDGGQVPASANIGFGWVTETDARALGSPQAPLSYFLNLRLSNPATAPTFANTYSGLSAPVISWQDIETGSGVLVQDEQQVLSPGALLAGLLAITSVAVLAGGRMAERIRRVGLLKAVGASPETVAAVLLAENLALALVAAVAGLAIGRLTAPLVADPGAALVGTAGAPSLTWQIAVEVVAVALVLALASTLVAAIRGARTSTVSALADTARVPRRRARTIAFSARLPVPLLLGLRLTARRPRRALLGTASVAVTATGITAVLAFRATVNLHSAGLAGGLGNPVANRDEQMLTILTVVLVALAALNAICTTWATVLDARHASALARALGATPRHVTTAMAAAQVLPAVPGALLGIPLGIGLFTAVSQGTGAAVPAAWQLAVAVLAVLAAVAVLAAIPARVGARRPVSPILQSETA